MFTASLSDVVVVAVCDEDRWTTQDFIAQVQDGTIQVSSNKSCRYVSLLNAFTHNSTAPSVYCIYLSFL